jgi:hypothetical protein
VGGACSDRGLCRAALTLLYQVLPDLSPDPGERSQASAKVLEVEPAVTWGAFRKRPGPDHACVPDPRDTERGVVISLLYELEGFKRRKARVRCAIFNAESGVRVRLRTRRFAVEGRSSSDRAIAPVWIRLPEFPPARYLARLELYTARDVLLAQAKSAQFDNGRGLSGPAVRPATTNERRQIAVAVRQSPLTSAVRQVRIFQAGVSTLDPAFALVDISASPEGKVDAVLGIARRRGRGWRLVDIGSAGVGCELAPEVRRGFGLTDPCP